MKGSKGVKRSLRGEGSGKKVENYNKDRNTYISRINKTALSKYDVLKPYLKKKTKVLDYGSGILSNFINKIMR